MAKVKQIPGKILNDQLKTLASNLMGRAELAARMGKSFGTDRDIYAALGYTKNPVFDDYYTRYERQDVASRIIDAPVEATWKEVPAVTETEDPEDTEFEKQWKEIANKRHIFHYLARADKVAGIGEYGVLLLGFDDTDNANPRNPVEKATELLYLRPYTQDNADVGEWETDPTNERYGLPKIYKLEASTAQKDGTQSIDAHWTRVIHLAEGLLENDVYGKPKLRPVLNRLQDLDLVSGGSAEMFWRGAFPGMAFKLAEDATMESQDKKALEDEIENYVHDLKRYMRIQGLDVQELKAQVADPKNHFDLLISLISAATGIPKRILTGSERGELASSQDEKNWATRIDERRKNYIGPMVLRVFIQRLIDVGVLPAPKQFEIEWSDLFAIGEKDRSDIAKVKAETLATYSNAMGADLIIPPSIFLKKFLEFDAEEIKEIEREVGKIIKEVEEIEPIEKIIE
jgi:phage-related protein (TIGR01555 family)